MSKSSENSWGGQFFYWVARTWEGVILTIQPFSKLRTVACEYWTSTKIKISMTCVPTEYEIKIKTVPWQWLQQKMIFLLGYNLRIFMWGIKTGWGELFPGGGDKQSFGWWGDSPSSHLYTYTYIKELCQQVFFIQWRSFLYII